MTSEEIEESLIPKCGRCNGLGMYPFGEHTLLCTMCAGTGLVEWEYRSGSAWKNAVIDARAYWAKGVKPPYYFEFDPEIR